MGGPDEEDDEEEFEYGKEYVHTADAALEEARNLAPPGEEDIWPGWVDGPPTMLRRTVWSPRFHVGKVSHDHRPMRVTLEFTWRKARLLSELSKNYGLLPSARYSSEWYGVYRVFVPGATIGRFCETDNSGTIYIGRAGSKRGWSILRTRLMQLAKREHHVTNGWDYHDARHQRYPWSSLSVDWAYTEHWLDHTGDKIIGAARAERWLLDSYNDRFGEYPPLNQEG